MRLVQRPEYIVDDLGSYNTKLEIGSLLVDRFFGERDIPEGTDPQTLATDWLKALGFDHVNWFRSETDDTTLFCHLWFMDEERNEDEPGRMQDFILSFSGADQIVVGVWAQTAERVM